MEKKSKNEIGVGKKIKSNDDEKKDKVDLASEASFPASDPPAWIGFSPQKPHLRLSKRKSKRESNKKNI